MCLQQHQIFHGHIIFQHFYQATSFRSNNTTADLIPYLFGSGIEEQIPVLPGRIQVPVPALDSRAWNTFSEEVQFLRQCQFLLWGIPTFWWFHHVQERTCTVFVFYRHLSSVATYVLRMDIIVTTGYCMCAGPLLVKTQLQWSNYKWCLKHNCSERNHRILPTISVVRHL